MSTRSFITCVDVGEAEGKTCHECGGGRFDWKMH